MLSVRADGRENIDIVKPTVKNLSSKTPSAPVDPELKGFKKLPG